MDMSFAGAGDPEQAGRAARHRHSEDAYPGGLQAKTGHRIVICYQSFLCLVQLLYLRHHTNALVSISPVNRLRAA